MKDAVSPGSLEKHGRFSEAMSNIFVSSSWLYRCFSSAGKNGIASDNERGCSRYATGIAKSKTVEMVLHTRLLGVVRCDETRFLQIDHIKMVCRGGNNDPLNLRVLCSGHNRLMVEVQIRNFGRCCQDLMGFIG